MFDLENKDQSYGVQNIYNDFIRWRIYKLFKRHIALTISEILIFDILN